MKTLARFRPHRSLVLAVLPALGYGFFALIAYLQYPGAYSPLTNTLSELGSPILNPNGSTFYRIGCVIGGTTTLLFFLHLRVWCRGGTRLQNYALDAMQGFGVVTGLAMALFAVFANNEARPHLILLGVLANGSLALMLLSLVALRRPHRPQRIRLMTTAVASGAILLMFLIPTHHWAEWLPAMLSQAYLWVVGYETTRVEVRAPIEPPDAEGRLAG